ncbi:hypothetical protein AAG570_008551 [Ranatra chinensis]|uniref:Uncharacterized protein n=1 Tax=Ranatra chinensis TaxID=642074 RepID=A0ABD0ZCE2_9HEMI
MASKRRDMFQKNKTQETTENVFFSNMFRRSRIDILNDERLWVNRTQYNASNLKSIDVFMKTLLFTHSRSTPRIASKRKNMFEKNTKQETTEIARVDTSSTSELRKRGEPVKIRGAGGGARGGLGTTSTRPPPDKGCTPHQAQSLVSRRTARHERESTSRPFASREFHTPPLIFSLRPVRGGCPVVTCVLRGIMPANKESSITLIQRLYTVPPLLCLYLFPLYCTTAHNYHIRVLDEVVSWQVPQLTSRDETHLVVRSSISEPVTIQVYANIKQ